MEQATALVLAGRRSGVLDPLAQAAGVGQKAVVPVAGKPLIEHVVTALAACPRVGAIRVVAHDEGEIAAIPAVAALRAEGRLSFHPAAFNLVDSITAAAAGARFPLLVTTADNVLVTPDGYAEFAEKALAARADAAAALARKEDVQAADPNGQKRFYEFSDGGYSNCNTYWIGSAEALRAAEIFRNGGQFVKFPRRIIAAFGLLNLIRFRLGLGSVEHIFAQISRRFGFRIVPVVLSQGEWAVDVDNPRTHGVAERILRERAGKPGATA